MSVDTYENEYIVVHKGDISTQTVWNNVFFTKPYLGHNSMFINIELLAACKAECNLAPPTSPSSSATSLPFTHPTSIDLLASPQAQKLPPTSGLLCFLFPCNSKALSPVLSLTGHLMFAVYVLALKSPLTMTLSEGAPPSHSTSHHSELFSSNFYLCLKLTY